MLEQFLLVVACRRMCGSKSLLSDVVVYLHDEELDGWRSKFGRELWYRYLLFRVYYDSLSRRQGFSRIVLWLAWTGRFFLSVTTRTTGSRRHFICLLRHRRPRRATARLEIFQVAL
jgi:hypothetical protein